MKGTVALVREQGATYAVLTVKDHVLSVPSQRDELIAFAEREFGTRTALMGERSLRTFGPPDIVRRLAHLDVSQLPWRDFTINN